MTGDLYAARDHERPVRGVGADATPDSCQLYLRTYFISTYVTYLGTINKTIDIGR